MINNTLPREIDYKGPAWATESRTCDDGGTIPWFVAPVGRGYLVAGVARDSCDLLGTDTPVTFELVNCPNESVPSTETYVVQYGGPEIVFESADAMRRYARVLLEVADDVDRLLGGAR